MLSPIGNGDYNDPNAWNYFGQQYVDIDGDSSTFNSSSARVMILTLGVLVRVK